MSAECGVRNAECRKGTAATADCATSPEGGRGRERGGGGELPGGRPEGIVVQPRMSRTGYEALDPLIDFCRECGGAKCYAGWPRKLLQEYLMFHVAQRCVVWLYEPCNARARGADTYQSPDRVLGLGIAWPEERAWIEERTAAGRCVFDWRPVEWGADSLYLADWVVRPDRQRRTEVPRRKEVVRTLARTLWCRWPEQRGKPIYYHRRGELKRLDGRTSNWAGLPEVRNAEGGARKGTEEE